MKVSDPAWFGAKGREAQGTHREVRSEGSVKQTHGSMNKNRLLRRHDWTSGQKIAKSIPTKSRERKVGEGVRKVMGLNWGDLRCAIEKSGAERSTRSADRGAEVSRGRSSDEGRETGWSEGPNGAPEWARERSGQVNAKLP